MYLCTYVRVIRLVRLQYMYILMDVSVLQPHIFQYYYVDIYVCIYIYKLVSWCGGELWVDQRKKCADICDVARSLMYAHILIDVN